MKIQTEKPRLAYIYARYSSSKQNDATIDVQLEMCRGYAERNNIIVVDEFIDKAKTARNIDREDLQRMIVKASNKKNKIDSILVYKIDRFSRDVQSALYVIGGLNKSGVSIRSITENFGDDPSGELVRNLLLSVAQYESQAKGVRVKDAMAKKYKDGFWLWRYPLGYTRTEVREVSSTGRKANITEPLQIIEAYREPLVALFEEAGKGKLRQTELAKLINDKHHFSKVNGKPLTAKMVDKIISCKFYYGVMESTTFGEAVGNHDSIVDEITWRKANTALGLNWGKSKKHDTQDLTLADFYHCIYCRSELEGYTKDKKIRSAGITKRYCYYACRGRQSRSGEAHIHISSLKLEESFLDFLEVIKPSPELLKLFRYKVMQKWNYIVSQQEKCNERVSARLEAIELEIDRVLDRYDRGDYTEERKQDRLKRLDDERAVLLQESAELKLEEYDEDMVMDFAEYFFSNLGHIWKNLEAHRKLTFQRYLFPQGVAYDDFNSRTEIIGVSSPCINLFCDEGLENEPLVTPRGIEPRSSP